MTAMPSRIDTATFGAGCYWCVEAIFQRLNGVISIESGFSGGHIKNPTYREVCTGTTGHAEVCRIQYDPQVIGYDELLEVFWKTHDPTTLNRQGNDAGTQYRSVIFYHNEQQKILASEYKDKLEKAGIWNDPIVTEIVPFEAFYKAKWHRVSVLRIFLMSSSFNFPFVGAKIRISLFRINLQFAV